MKHGTKYQSKQEKVFSIWFLVMSVRKILETFIRFFPSSFNRKYVHTIACTVVFVQPYPGRNATCPLSRCSKNDGPRGRFYCISTVSCKGSVCVEVLTIFYGIQVSSWCLAEKINSWPKLTLNTWTKPCKNYGILDLYEIYGPRIHKVQTLTTKDCKGPQTNMPENVGSIKTSKNEK